MDNELFQKRCKNVIETICRCVRSGSNWGVVYWRQVLDALIIAQKNQEKDQNNQKKP